MKKLTALFLTMLFIVGLTACKDKDSTITSSDSTASEASLYTENGVGIDKSSFPNGTTFKVEALGITDDKYNTAKNAFADAISFSNYEITAENNGEAVKPYGKVTVYFPIPNAYDTQVHNITVYYLADNGNIELVESVVQSTNIKATLTHFSTYSVVVTEKSQAPQNQTYTNAEVKAIAERIIYSNEYAFSLYDSDKGAFDSSYTNLAPIGVFNFLLYYLDESQIGEYCTYGTYSDGIKYVETCDMPVKTANEFAEIVFGCKYNFDFMAENGVIHYESNGGGYGGPHNTFVYKSFKDRGNDKLQITLDYYEASDESGDKESVLFTGILTVKKHSSGIWQILDFSKI